MAYVKKHHLINKATKRNKDGSIDMTYELELPWFNKNLNPNEKASKMAIYRHRKKQKNDAFWIAKQAGTPSVRDTYQLQVLFCPPISRHRDIDNCMAACKGMFDGIALAWGVNDKDFRFPNPDFGDVIKHGKVLITIEKI